MLSFFNLNEVLVFFSVKLFHLDNPFILIDGYTYQVRLRNQVEEYDYGIQSEHDSD
jgi:hypothetical protein